MAKGHKTGGRQRGTPNKVTVEAKAFCACIVDDPHYQARLRKRALSGQLPPAIEAMIWYYAKGKPKEQVSLDVNRAADIERRLLKGRELMQQYAKAEKEADRVKRAEKLDAVKPLRTALAG
jgi:hypothetical protein